MSVRSLSSVALNGLLYLTTKSYVNSEDSVPSAGLAVADEEIISKFVSSGSL